MEEENISNHNKEVAQSRAKALTSSINQDLSVCQKVNQDKTHAVDSKKADQVRNTDKGTQNYYFIRESLTGHYIHYKSY